MTNVAQKFITELRAGKISEAIDTIKSGLEESQTKLIEQKRLEILESYGFKLSEKKKTMKEEDDEENMEESKKK